MVIVSWFAYLGVATIVFALVVYVACLVAFEPPRAGPLLLTALTSRSIDCLPLLIDGLTSTPLPALVKFGVSVLSFGVLAILLVRWVGLTVGGAVYATLITIMLQFGLLFLTVT